MCICECMYIATESLSTDNCIFIDKRQFLINFIDQQLASCRKTKKKKQTTTMRNTQKCQAIIIKVKAEGKKGKAPPVTVASCEQNATCVGFAKISQQFRRGVSNNKAHFRVHIETETVAATEAETKMAIENETAAEQSCIELCALHISVCV